MADTFSDTFVADLRAVFQVQHHTLSRVEASLNGVEDTLDASQIQPGEIEDLDAMMAELEAGVNILVVDDLDGYDDADIARLYGERRHTIARDLHRIGYRDWRSFVAECRVECLREGLDPLAPYEAFLTDEDLAQLRMESYDEQYRWDPWDYAVVGSAGVLAALTDFFLVKIPLDASKSMLGGKSRYHGQTGSPLTKWLQGYNTAAGGATAEGDYFARFARFCEARCKTPFDAQSLIKDGVKVPFPGMNGDFHRQQSFGHDPTPFGLVVGILDMLRGTVSGFGYDPATGTHTLVSGSSPGYGPNEAGIMEAVVKWFGHMLSDVATTKGLPAPLMTLVEGINVGSFGLKGSSAGRIARWMYDNGYDFRHFLVSGITPGVVEIVVRGYLMLRHYAEHGETAFPNASNPKVRSMLLAAHGIAAAANAGKVALYQGNPCAINQAEWMALFRYLVPHLKYLAFDKHRLRLEHMDRISGAEWDALARSSAALLETTAKDRWPVVELGRLPLN